MRFREHIGGLGHGSWHRLFARPGPRICWGVRAGRLISRCLGCASREIAVGGCARVRASSGRRDAPCITHIVHVVHIHVHIRHVGRVRLLDVSLVSGVERSTTGHAPMSSGWKTPPNAPIAPSRIIARWGCHTPRSAGNVIGMYRNPETPPIRRRGHAGDLALESVSAPTATAPGASSHLRTAARRRICDVATHREDPSGHGGVPANS